MAKEIKKNKTKDPFFYTFNQQGNSDTFSPLLEKTVRNFV